MVINEEVVINCDVYIGEVLVVKEEFKIGTLSKNHNVLVKKTINYKK